MISFDGLSTGGSTVKGLLEIAPAQKKLKLAKQIIRCSKKS
jgi:hypothetical protein